MIQGGNKKIAGGIGRNVGNIRGLKNLLSDPELKPLLSPYEDIITAAQHFTEATTIPIDIIAGDLRTIKSLYGVFLNEVETSMDKGDLPRAKKLTTKEKKLQLFSYLLQRFSKDIGDAAERHGMKDFANAVRNEGILAKPSVIGNYYPAVMKNTMAATVMSNRIMKSVIKNITEDRFEEIYRNLTGQIMEFKRVITEEDLNKLYREWEGARDVSRYLGQETKNVSIRPLSINDDGWLNPGAISMIAYVLDSIYRELH